MANNTRALRLKVNAEEFDSKFSDIKRLTGNLKSLVEKVMVLGGPLADAFTTIEASDDIGPDLRIVLKWMFRENPDSPLAFELWNNGTLMKKDSQFDLATVRRVHDNLDVLIECAENLCEDAGRLDQFRAKMARFEV